MAKQPDSISASKSKPLTETQEFLETAKKEIDLLKEITEHVTTLTDAGFYCEVMFDSVRNLHGAPPVSGITVLELKEKQKARTLMMYRVPADINKVISGLRKLTGKGV